MRDDESCTSSVEDESVDRSMSALRLGFKALYEEIDMLSEQATRTVQAIVKESADESVQLKKEDIDDLITYARKFIRETRKTIVTFDEHGVQCEPERRSSKKVSTPKAWKKPIVVERAAAREDITEVAHRRRSAVTVIQSFPRDDGPCEFCDEREPEQERVSASPAAVRIPAQPLNNTVAVETMPEVRSIGTNVNFVSQRGTVKRSNVQCVAASLTKSAVVPKNGPSTGLNSRIRPVSKARAPPSVPTSSARRPLSRPTFSDDQFKVLFDRFIQMQLEKRKEAPTDKENVAPQNKETAVDEPVDQIKNEKEKSIVFPEDVGSGNDENGSAFPETDRNRKEIVESSSSEKVLTDAVVEAAESLGFTSHILPSLSIKGRWDANLKVQHTGSIAIVDETDKSCDELLNDNVKYVEFRQELAKNRVIKNDEQQNARETPRENVEKDFGSEQSKLCVEVKESAMPSKSESSNSETEPTTSGDEEAHELPLIRIPRSACKVAKHSSKPNKYLDPFVKMKPKEPPPKKTNIGVLFDTFDDDTSSFGTDVDLEDEDDVRMLLSLKDVSTSGAMSDSVPPEAKGEQKLPTSVQCQRSLLEVSSIPALRSPEELARTTVSSQSDLILASNGQFSNRFLDNLRIWKTAVDMQSQNMKMSNELAENLDALKGNLRQIAEESSKVAKIATEVESYARQSYVPVVRPVSSAQRSRSCECFGCQHTFEGERGSRATMSSPPYDHKQFQRTILESNPRYAKTIRKICELGSGERPTSTRSERDESAKRAAQKFLQSLQRNTTIQRNGCSSSRSSSALLRSPSKSVSSRSEDSGAIDFCSLITCERENDSDSETVSVCSSMCGLPVSADTNDYGSSAGQTATSNETDLSSLTSNFRSQCDLGEVLSPGEIK